jgi:hypothetical protein
LNLPAVLLLFLFLFHLGSDSSCQRRVVVFQSMMHSFCFRQCYYVYFFSLLVIVAFALLFLLLRERGTVHATILTRLRNEAVEWWFFRSPFVLHWTIKNLLWAAKRAVEKCATRQ